MEPIKLMIVEDNADLRRMIGDYFASQEDMEVVATAPTAPRRGICWRKRKRM